MEKGAGTIKLKIFCHNLSMSRQARVSVADVVYHVINRANGRFQIFHTDKDYQHFESLRLHEVLIYINGCCMLQE